MKEDLKKCLEELYYFLRDEGYSVHSQAIKKLVFNLEEDNVREFKKNYEASIIWGGSGSIRDIDLRDSKAQIKLDNYLKKLKEYNLGW